MKLLLVVFREKISFEVIWSFSAIFYCLIGLWSKLRQATVTIGSLNSQDMISFMITTGSLNSQDMIRVLKQWRHDFSGKHLCDGYCMDIMWCLCVEVNVQQRVIWCCEKASLRICYVILFECKGLAMLKTDSLTFWGNIKYFTAQRVLWCCVKKIRLVKIRRLPA